MMEYWGDISRNGCDKAPYPNRPVVASELPAETLVFDTLKDGSFQIEEDAETFTDIISAIEADTVLDVGNRRCILAQRLENAFHLVAPERTGKLRKLCEDVR